VPQTDLNVSQFQININASLLSIQEQYLKRLNLLNLKIEKEFNLHMSLYSIYSVLERFVEKCASPYIWYVFVICFFFRNKAFVFEVYFQIFLEFILNFHVNIWILFYKDKRFLSELILKGINVLQTSVIHHLYRSHTGPPYIYVECILVIMFIYSR
jgi:hypothetical protein